MFKSLVEFKKIKKPKHDSKEYLIVHTDKVYSKYFQLCYVLIF